ncbi:aldehyde ferredoxin oxidoreductase family protein [Candidatus Cryosericum hinesii]|nr:aldehyde ferredoxin oxidoreductase C-terminal domain-containing protein [Candidatus Cryosericum hinesii]
MKTIEEMRQAHKVLATYSFTPGGVHAGYTDRRLYVDLTTNTIEERAIEPMVREKFTGGRGYGMYYLWQAVKPATHWNDPENELIFTAGPLTGLTQYPGSGKTHSVTISPETGVPVDNNGGGFFAPFMKFSGFDCIEIQGKAAQDVMLVIDGNKGFVTIETAPDEPTNSYDLPEVLHAMYADGDDDRKNVSVATSGEGADHSLLGLINLSYWDAKRKHTRIKQLARGGPGTVFRDKGLRAVVIHFSGTTPTLNCPVDMEPIKLAGGRMNKEILTLDHTHSRMREIGTGNTVEILDKCDVLPVMNYKFGSDPRTEKIKSDVWLGLISQGMPDGCWLGCSMSCAHGVDNFELLTGPLKGQKVLVDGPEYETIGGLGTNTGSFDPHFVLEANFYCDYYGLDLVAVSTLLAFLMECYENGILTKEITGGLDLHFGSDMDALELIHQIGEGRGFGKVAGLGIHRLKKLFIEEYHADAQFVNDIGMEVKGMEVSEYNCKDSLAQQGGYAMASKGPQHDEAWLIFMDQVKGQLPTFADKAEALSFFPLFRTWFSLMGLCKLPWNDSEPRDNHDRYTGIEAARIPEHVENYLLLYTGMTGHALDLDGLLAQSKRVYDFQRLFNLRMGQGTRKDDWMPYRGMGPVTEEEYLSRQERYDKQLVEAAKVDIAGMSLQQKMAALRQYRESQYRQLQDAVYARRGWDADGVPTLETVKADGIDFPELVDLIEKHTHKA